MNKIYKIGELPFKFISRKQDETFTIFESDQCIIKILTETLNNRSSIVKELTNEEDFSEMEKTFVQKLAEELEKQGLADSITVTLDNTDCLVLSNVDTEEELVIGNESVEDIRNFLKFLVENGVEINKANVHNFAFENNDQKKYFIDLYTYLTSVLRTFKKLIEEGYLIQLSKGNKLDKSFAKKFKSIKKALHKEEGKVSRIMNSDKKFKEYLKKLKRIDERRQAEIEAKLKQEAETSETKPEIKANELKLSSKEKRELLALKQNNPEAFRAKLKELKNFAETEEDLDVLKAKSFLYLELKLLKDKAEKLSIPDTNILQGGLFESLDEEREDILEFIDKVIETYDLENASDSVAKIEQAILKKEQEDLDTVERSLGLNEFSNFDLNGEFPLPNGKRWPEDIIDAANDYLDSNGDEIEKKALTKALQSKNASQKLIDKLFEVLDKAKNDKNDLSDVEQESNADKGQEQNLDTDNKLARVKKWAGENNLKDVLQDNYLKQLCEMTDESRIRKSLKKVLGKSNNEKVRKASQFIEDRLVKQILGEQENMSVFNQFISKYKVMNFDCKEVQDSEFGRCFEDKFGSLWSTDPDKDPKAKLLWESKDGKVETTKVSDSTLSNDEMDDTLSQDIESNADLEGGDDDFDLGGDDADLNLDLDESSEEDLDLDDESFSEDDLDFDLGEEEENTDSDEDFDLDFDLEEDIDLDQDEGNDNLALQAAKDTIKEMTPIIEKLIDKIK